jgi:hypothetical protein
MLAGSVERVGVARRSWWFGKGGGGGRGEVGAAYGGGGCMHFSSMMTMVKEEQSGIYVDYGVAGLRRVTVTEVIIPLDSP